MIRHPTRPAVVVDETDLHSLLKDIPRMSNEQRDDTDVVLRELQNAVKDHERILARQARLLERLREELKGVNKGD
jgi:uncharacterized coiled-coil protein SlyX